MNRRPLANQSRGDTPCRHASARRALSVATGLLTTALSGSPLLAATPDDNTALAATHGALIGLHNGAVLGGFAPPPFDSAFEALAFSTDTSLRNTPPVFSIPNDFAREPNASAFGSNSPFSCVYRFRRPVAGTRIPGGIEDQYSSIFGFAYDGVDAVWGDLGKPNVYHAQADVDIRATGGGLGAGLVFPEFREGIHSLSWSATTQLNVPIDVGLPLVLMASASLAEGKVAKRLAALGVDDATKKASTIVSWVQTAANAGLIASDVSGTTQAISWYDATTVDTTSNRATQRLTVWDTHVPYVRDARFGAGRIVEQTIELEATDFGGVRFERVAEFLENQFLPTDDCGKQFVNSNNEHPRRLLTISDTPNEVFWNVREVNGGPYQPNAPVGSNQEQIGTVIETSFLQNVLVVDTQAPILVPPAGFARYSDQPVDLAADASFLGRPRVVDLADPAPQVSNNAPDLLELDRRYAIDWSAVDASGNRTVPDPERPEQLTQFVTIKSPGTNTAPTATTGISTATVTSVGVDIELRGSDGDVIDGRADPLAFEIVDFPQNGEFEAPLLPFFIEDYRLTPLGEREEGDDLSRTSPLQHLAAGLLDVTEHGRYLNDEICSAPSGSLNEETFGNVIPVNFVYKPRYIESDDRGFYYIQDHVWVCGEGPNAYLFPDETVLAPIPRISKWTADGDYLGMMELYPIASMPNSDIELQSNARPVANMFIDRSDRIWVPLGKTTLQGTIETIEFETFLTMDLELSSPAYLGPEPDLSISTPFKAMTADIELGFYYILRDSRIEPTAPDKLLVFDNNLADLLHFDDANAVATFNLDNSVAINGSDVDVDSEGNVYITDLANHRIHKYEAIFQDGNGDWQPGAYVGWLGACTANRTDPNGVPYSACDEARQVSLGFACTDERCARDTQTGSEPGQFDEPMSLVFDRNDIFYVADRANSRIQRFAADGTFSGEARSTGTGINEGAEPGFILGNFGMPELLSVNSSTLFVLELNSRFGDYFVHVFKTLPFFDITDSSATVRYRSSFNFQGTDSFTYRSFDGIDRSDPASVAVDVSRAFRPPERLGHECYADEQLNERIPCTLDEDSSIVLRLSGLDPDGFQSTGGLDILSFSIENEPFSGTLEPLSSTDNAAVYRYTPIEHFNGADQFDFNASDGVMSASEPRQVALTVNPVPDPVVIEFTANPLAARGFPYRLTAEFSDADRDPAFQPALTSVAWGDGMTARAPAWINSGRQDLNGRAESPQIDTTPGNGMLFAVHEYADAGTYPLSVAMSNAPGEGFAETIAATTVEVIEATVVTARARSSTQPVQPDIAFGFEIDVQNLAPSGWAGLIAANTAISFDVPEGLALLELDARCSGTSTVTCQLGDLAPGAQTLLSFTGRIDIETARVRPLFEFLVDITDDGPKATTRSVASLAIAVSDVDQDGVIDADDAFPFDRRYSRDADNDGLDDAWERRYGLDPTTADDPDSDLDGDGRSLADEFAAGSSPVLADFDSMRPGDVVTPLPGGTDDAFGIRIAGGDLNGDGYAETIIGASKWNGSGAVFMAMGGPSGAGPAVPVATAAANQTRFGQSVAVGDFDNNGRSDLAIAASNGIAIHYNNGAIYAEPDTVLDVFTTPTQLTIQTYADDLDDDGVDDLLVVTTLGIVATQFQLYLSSQGGLGAVPETFITTDVALGDSAVMSDFDGDGLRDLAIGGATTNDGVVRVFLGADNDWTQAQENGNFTLSFELLPIPGVSGFGISLASNGDLNGDGIDELVIGAFRGRGHIHTYFSSQRYWEDPTVRPGITQGLGAGDTSNDPFGDQLGTAVAMGDFNGDGVADLVAGANRAGASDEGLVDVYRGNPSGFVRRQAFPGDTPWDMFGFHVAVPGDIDGDGYDDFVAGAPDLLTPERPAPDGGFVRFFYHDFAAGPGADDADDDRIDSAFDNCPAVANPGQSDVDGDGLGDVCDDDADGDGFPNAMDDCPLIPGPQSDFDGDGLGDACDPDDDNDQVNDNLDAFPRDARYVADTDLDGMPDRYESDNGLNPNDAGDAADDLDGDGRSNVDEFLQGTDIANDDVAPALTAPGNLEFTAVGPLTAVVLGDAIATDVLDGAVPATVDNPGPYRPGRHLVNWRAVDIAGNESTATQTVSILPLANFSGANQFAEEGASVTVDVVLNGDAVDYPVIVPFDVSGSAEDGVDYVLAASDVRIDSGRLGSVTVDIPADGLSEGDEQIELRMLQPMNAAAGSVSTHRVDIVERNVAPRLDLQMTQAGEPRTSVIMTHGPVAVQATVNDPNAGDSHSFDWAGTDAELLAAGTQPGNAFSFDPASLMPGVYRLMLRVADSGGESVALARDLQVVAAAPLLLPTADTDGDGIDDATEGLADQDGNGIPAYEDPFDSERLLVGTTGELDLVQVPEGLTLRLGRVALASGSDARVSFADITDWGNGGTANDGSHNYPTGLFDFVIDGLTSEGDSATVVLSLPVPIPANGLYRKFTAAAGWVSFVEDDNNRLYSAPGLDGACPAPGHSQYVPGLTEGHRCLQLLIEDGGSNDADGSANAQISDPGGVAVRATGLSVMAAVLPLADQRVNPGASDVPMLRYRLNSNSSDIAIRSMTLAASGSGNDQTAVGSVRAWLDENADGAVSNGEAMIGEGRFDRDDGRLDLLLTTPLSLPMGDTDILITFDY